MGTNFPGSVDDLTNPASGTNQNALSHAAQHANVNDAMEAVQTYLLDPEGVSQSAFALRGDLASAGNGKGPALVYFAQAGTGAAGRTVLDELRETIKSTQFATLQDAVTAAENKRLLVIGNYTITSTITLPSNIVIDFDPAATITSNTANISHFKATSKTNITVRGGKFVATNAGVSANIGAIHLDSCTECLVERNRFVGMQWAGVFFLNCTKCKVVRNSFSAFLGTVQDSADVCFYGNTSYCTAEDNDCYGGNYHGVLVQGHTAGAIPLRNTVHNNRIGAHVGYGIIAYQIEAANTYTRIIGNTVEGIIGTAFGGSAGAGIYVQGSGGCLVSGNAIKNCCISSANETLTPAGIGINNLNAPLEAAIVSGNTITDIRNYSGINVSSSNVGAVVSANTISFSYGVVANTAAIYINAASRCVVDGNQIYLEIDVPIHGIFAYANGSHIEGLTITNNHVRGSTIRGIRVDQTGGFKVRRVTIANNYCVSATGSYVAMDLSAIEGGTVVGNSLLSDSQVPLRINSCTEVRGSANRAICTNGGNSVSTTGTCTASYFDDSNYYNKFVLNAGTGINFERRGNSGLFTGGADAVGDRVIQSGPVVGTPKSWSCTAAGSPGTWVSEGNL